ncbi:MAG: hypothetical protein HOY71_09670 [Nonomuraea sp.]|nr:hypothetical protein [Nonomuraea sp.]
MLEQLGPAADVAVPVLRRHFHDAEYVHLDDRVAIARALFAITGDPEGLVAPLLEAVTARPLHDLGGQPSPAEFLAVEALATMGPAAEAAVPALEAIAYSRARVTEHDVWSDEALPAGRPARPDFHRAGPRLASPSRSPYGEGRDRVRDGRRRSPDAPALIAANQLEFAPEREADPAVE